MSQEFTDEEVDALIRMAFKAWRTSDDHGFHEAGRNDNPSAWVANLHGEVSEFWDAYRHGNLDELCDKGIPLTCAEEELADIILRAFDVAVQKNIDIGRALRIKQFYNIDRPYMNGGKIA
jgi:hypothetical protein